MTVVEPFQQHTAAIQVRHVNAVGAVVITVTGDIAHHDAAALSRRLHAALDTAPAVVVVDLSRVNSCVGPGLAVLAVARERANSSGTDLHLVDLGNPAPHAWLTRAGLFT